MKDSMIEELDISNIEHVKSVHDIEKLNLSFENVYAYLELIIKLQEGGNVSLEDSIKLYKIGKLFIDYANTVLNKAKLEIEQIN